MDNADKTFTVSDDGQSIKFDGKVVAFWWEHRKGWTSVPCADPKVYHAVVTGIVGAGNGESASDVAARMGREYHQGS